MLTLTGGAVTNSQLFPFDGSAGPLAISPENQAGTCFTVKGNVINVANCDTSDANQSFTFDGAAAATPPNAAVSTPGNIASVTSDNNVASSTPPCTDGTVTVTVTAAVTDAAASIPVVTAIDASTSAIGVASTTLVVATTTAASQVTTTKAPVGPGIPDFNPTTPVPVSRAGGELQPSAVAQAQAFDNTATRAFTAVSLKASNGQCLFIDPTAGDFRENLIPIAVQDCNGSANEKFDFITQGAHNNAQNSTLVVSSLVSDTHESIFKGCVLTICRLTGA
jgi:hypothetical protein